MDDPHPPFSADDRLADALAADAGVAARLTALDPWFARLMPPSAQPLLAALATIGEAAAAAGVPVASVLNAINAGQGGSCCAGEPHDATDAPPEAVPAWRAGFDEAAAAVLDVRPMLAAGEEPFAAILHRAATVADGGGLILDAPFNPQPLRRVLHGKGFATCAEQQAAGHWRVFCLRGAERAAPPPTAPKRRTWRAADGVHIDVRGLDAPAPLTAILTLIDSGDHDGCIVVHHDREPLYLYSELAERGWRHQRLAAPPGEVRLALRRDA